MRISERVDNAVRSMAELATSEGESLKAEVIAERQDISLKYLLDILRDLKRAELVRSRRGPNGGFTLSRSSDSITLADVFRAIDGPLADVHDESVPPSDARQLAQAHGSAELSLLQGAGHRLRHDPRAVAILMGWLERVRTG